MGGTNGPAPTRRDVRTVRQETEEAMFLARKRRAFARVVTRTLTGVCDQLQVFLPDPPTRSEQAPVSDASPVTTRLLTADELADVRREIEHLAERRLLVPLSDAELARYEQLCAIEHEALRHEPLHC